ncbi:MAG TPA: tetratricopeptide repeat protein [Pseudohongiella sp.]|nr:tetratricopeptide repeat protein [Pseudohongiella sp.]
MKAFKTALAVCVMALVPAFAGAQPGGDLGALVQAAESGDMAARFELGNRYLNGNGVLQDASEALRWFTLAAEQGSRNAQYNVGVIYLNGVGVEPDATKALEWFHRAADNGDAPSQFALGVLHFEGLPELPVDIAQAYKWFLLAGAAGDEMAGANAVLVQEMLAPEVVEAMQEEARQWIENFNARRAANTSAQ